MFFGSGDSFKDLQTLHGFQVFRQIRWVQRVLGHQQVQQIQQIQAHHGLPGEKSQTVVKGRVHVVWIGCKISSAISG